jgi:hypothetical protein
MGFRLSGGIGPLRWSIPLRQRRPRPYRPAPEVRPPSYAELVRQNREQRAELDKVAGLLNKERWRAYELECELYYLKTGRRVGDDSPQPPASSTNEPPGLKET